MVEKYTSDNWRLGSACGYFPNPDLFTSTSPRHIELAKKVCDTCPVLKICLDEDISSTELSPGIVAGLTRKERDMFKGQYKAKIGKKAMEMTSESYNNRRSI